MAGMKRKILKTAVIGCGRIGAFTVHQPGDDLPASYFPTNHCAAIRAVPGMKLTAVCDANLKSAEKAGKLHDVKNIYSDFKKMIREQAPDIIAIATRMAGRDKIITFSANHGVKGLHIEKPLAPNLNIAIKCLDAIEKNGIAVSYGAVRRYMPIYRQAKEMLGGGKFGKLRKITVDIGKSQLMWSHPHTVDLLDFFTDGAESEYVKSSFKYDKKDVSRNRIDMDPILDHAILKFKNGIIGELTDNGGDYISLKCEKGEILIQIGGKWLKSKYGSWKMRSIRIKKGPSGRCGAMAELRDSINLRKPTSLTTKSMLSEQKILMALGLSGITGKKINPAELNDNFTITGKFNGLYP